MENEHKQHDITLAEFRKDLQFIKELLADVTGQLKAMSQNYVTKADLTELKKEKEEVHREFERRIRLLEDQASKLQAYGTIALVLLGLLQFGITLFVNKIL